MPTISHLLPAFASPYILVPLIISLMDVVIVLRARFIKPVVVDPDTVPDEDFTILLPIFGDIKYLKNVDFLSSYGKKVILCTTTRETPEFDAALGAIAAKHGFGIYRSQVPISSAKGKANPNPWRLFTSTLYGRPARAMGDQKPEFTLSDEARDEIMREGSRMITTTYAIFMDGDTVAKDDLRTLVGVMKEKDFDLASVRVLASRKDTLIEKLQSVEYELAMDARRVYPWLTSGAAMVAKTHVIKEIMGHHSLFFSGGDIEIGKLGKMMGYNVGHIAFVFCTDVPRTFRAWFRQRLAWFGGGFRHAVINMHQYTWRHPVFFFYSTFLVFLLTPVRWYEMLKYPLVLPFVIMLYWLLILAVHWKKVRPFYIFFPFYALFQVMVLVPLGVLTYFRMAFAAENTGMIRFRDDA